MRPKILHCVDDNSMGGVNFALQALCDSSLAQDYDFEIRYVDLTRPSRISTSADIICFHGASSWRKLIGLVWLKLQFPRTPFMLQEHHYCQHFVVSQIPSVSRFYRMLKMTYALMDYVIAISPSQRQWMITNNLVTTSAIELVGQGRDLSQFVTTNTQAISATHKIPVIAAYGRFHQQKGFDLLLQAMANIATSQCQLKLAGEGPQLTALTKLAAPLAHVEIVGRVGNVADFLMTCDAVIIPSRWEPFGLVFIEALAMQKWIISTEVDGLGDQLTEITSRWPDAYVTPIKEVSVASITQAIEAFIADWQAGQVSSMDVLEQNMAAELQQPYLDKACSDKNGLDKEAQVQLWSIEQWDRVQAKWRDLFTKILS
ncbi:glycosyltransferase [Shewanella sp. HL-SH4]|uniref:glycosyltransferase n=1 Tax=Shewanella sp. HL-SH4 TaxID=3436240 RepID=UPI003EC0793F